MTVCAPTSRERSPLRLRLCLFCGLMLAATSLGGCAGKNFAEIRPGIERVGHYIEGVPFYPQGESACGPAALAGIFEYWGYPAELKRIIASVYQPELRGTLPTDMEIFAREWGFDTISSSGTLDDLKAFIRQGVPVICMLDLGFGIYHKPHYITAIGYDDVNAVIVEHDGITPNRLVGYDAFDKVWGRAGRWMLVIMPKLGGMRREP